MKERAGQFFVALLAAVEWGLVWGFKIAIPVLLVWTAISWSVGDYVATRQMAQLGAHALQIINAYQEAGVLPKELAAPKAPAPPPPPEKKP